MGSKSKKNKKEAKKNPDANMAVEVSGNRVFGGGNKVITDERFALSQKDPRFQDVPKHKTKVAIDSRFSRMFTDKNFSASSARVDKRGRTKQDGDSSQTALKHYYRMDNEEKKQKKQREESDDDDEDLENDEDDGEYESDDTEKLKKARQTLPKSKSVPESETDSSGEEEDDEEEEEEADYMDDDTSTDTDEEDEAYLEEETTGLQLEENVPEIEKETHRLAIVNLDWNQVRAVDLYVVLNSFAPKTGQIVSVSVYPSDFGLKQMELEAVRGPVGLFDDEDGKNKDDSDDDSDDDTEIDPEKLRKYELNRLRYYYAVVECDTVDTADHIYKACDGIEFERSSNMLDLRFIPDSFEIKHPPRDVATEAPSNYEGIDFQTRALQQSKIELTWDEVEPQRSKKLKRKINAEKESEYVKDEEQLKEFLASSESESETDEDENNNNNKNNWKRQKTDAYRALIQPGSNSDSDSDSDDNNGMEMEVTFNTGLEDLSKKILEKKDKKSETVWDAYLRKKKEKKKARKSKSMNSDDSDYDSDREVEESGDFFAGDSDKKSKKGKKKEMDLDKEGEASKAELELLLGDDNDNDGNVKGYNLKKKTSKGKKVKKGKGEGMDEEKIPSADLDDSRFSSLFTRPDYALDPTDPQFKRSAAYVRQVAHKQHKGDMDRKGEQFEAPSEVDKIDSKKDKHEMSMLLKSVKMKSKQLPVPSDSKKSKRKGK